MKNVLSKRLILLGAAGLFARGVAAPVQLDLDSGTLDKAAAYAKGKKETTPSELLKITYRSKGDFSVESVYTNDGSALSGSTVAAPFGNLLLVGTVKDDKMLVLRTEIAP